MKASVEKLSSTRVKLTIEVPFADLQPSMDEAYKRIATQVNIPGFRKGKIPSRIIDQRVGRAVVLEEAVNDAIPSSLAQALIENDIVQLSRPNVDVTQLDEEIGLIYTAELDIRPEFDLPVYSELKVVVDDAEVTEEQIEEQLTALRARFGSLKQVEREARDTDTVLVDLRGSFEGVAVDDITANALSYEVGSESMVPGFDEAVRGAKAGDVRTFVFTPTAGEYTGKQVEVEVTVTTVRERELPDADDSFAMMASEFDTIGELREDVRTRLGRLRLVEQAYQARELVQDELLGAIKMDVPEGAITDEVEQHFADGHGDEAHKSEFESNVRTGLKTRIVLDKIAETEDVQINDSELSQWLIQESQRYGMSPDQFANELVQAGQIESAIAEVRRAKALATVLESVQVVDKSGNAIDLNVVLRGDQPDDEVIEVNEADEADETDAAFDASSDEENFEADE